MSSLPISNPRPLRNFLFLGYLSEVDQVNRIVQLYGRRIAPQQYEYYTTHDTHPFLRIPLGILKCPLQDRQIIKVPGYNRPFKVNLNEEPKDQNDPSEHLLYYQF